jgi:hypothetical protein
MRSTRRLVPLLFLAACALPPAPSAAKADRRAPVLTSSLPIGPTPTTATAVDAPADTGMAGPGIPSDPVVPTGLGFTTSPAMTYGTIGYEIPVEGQLTVGPSLGFGFDDHESLFTATGQFRYYLGGDDKLQPFVAAGAGLGYVDMLGRDSEWGLVGSLGGGLRIQTSEHGTIGTQVDYFESTERLSGERGWFAWQVVQFSWKF